ncbi:TonB-dependent receptor [Hirschia maritima]|uniref:TonB-dependent receptor n=1 Tax=Hirschia maritima TaxID=1121961 RepID=UPI00035D1739|nr:TonB-dependent receptor [Hirschia maritima]
MSKKVTGLIHQAWGKGTKLGLSASVGVAAILGLPAYAQEQQADTEAERRVLDAITVTSTKRATTLQDTPIAVSVVSDEEILKAEIQDIADIQSLVPSLRVTTGSTIDSTAFSIRGFASGSGGGGIEPSVGVFVDGVYRSRASSSITDLPNLERVEVLRGPQSTLFGKNASIGVISLVTKAPEFEWGGYASATAGNYGLLRSRAGMTGPLTDKLAFSLDGNFQMRDGYGQNLQTGQDLNDKDRWSIRGQLQYEPTEDTTFRLIVDRDEINESCCLTSNIVAGTTTRFVFSQFGDIVLEDPFSYDTYTDIQPRSEISNSGVSLQLDQNFDPFTLTSITSYRTSENYRFADGDGGSSADIALSVNDSELDTFSQEIRLTSNSSDSSFDWMVGGYYFKENLDVEGQFTFGADLRRFVDIASRGAVNGLEATLGLPPGGAFFQDGQGAFENRGQENEAWSIFGTLDWRITDKLTATVGMNYTADEKEVYVNQVNTDSFAALDFVGLGVVAFGLTPAQAQTPGVNPLLGFRSFQFLRPFVDFPNAVEDGRSDDSDTTYTVRLAYDMTDSVNLYGSYATGFKATSWNLGRDSKPTADLFTAGFPLPSSPIADAGLAVPNLVPGTRNAAPETTEVIEIGMKAQWDRFSVNLAVFDQKVENFQATLFLGGETGGFAFANAGEQSTQGVEIETNWAITDNLRLGVNGTWMDANYDDFQGAPGPGGTVVDLSGTKPANRPDLTTTTSISYDRDIGSANWYIRADWRHQSGAPYFDNPTNQQLIGIEQEYDLVNASSGITLDNDLSFSVWGRNIFEEEYITGAFPTLLQTGSISGFTNQPATYGVTVRKVF